MPEGVRDNEEDFQGIPGFQNWHASIESIRFISPDAAIVEGSAVTTLDSGQFDEESTVIVTRTDTGWKIAAARVMNFDQTLLNLMTSDARASDQRQIKDAAAAEMDPTQLAPHIYQVELENERTRVLRVTVRPGETRPRHSHPDRAVIYVNK